MPDVIESSPEKRSASEELQENLQKELGPIEQDLKSLNTEMKPAGMDDRTFFNGLELRKCEIEQMRILLTLHAADPEVQKQAEILNGLYTQIWKANEAVGRGVLTRRQLGMAKEAKDVAQQIRDLDQKIAEIQRQAEEARNTVKARFMGIVKSLVGKEESAKADETKEDLEKRKDLMKKLADANTKVELINLKGGVVKKFVKEEDKLDDRLDANQRAYLRGLSESNDPDALFETYVYSQFLYKELTQKILRSPKEQRDKDIGKLMTTLRFYQYLQSPDFQADYTKRVAEAAEDILKNQPERFEGLRGAIQSGVDKIADYSISAMDALSGDKESFARYITVLTASTAKQLAKPVTYDKALVDSVVARTLGELTKIGGSFDGSKVAATLEACERMKALPDLSLSEEEMTSFMKTFDGFSVESTKLMKMCLTLHQEMGTEAYILSHGEKNGRFPADPTWRAKLQYNGRDLLRMAQVYSPFGVFLPEKAQLKPKDQRKDGDKIPGDEVYLSSGFDQGFWKEHEFLSVITQGAMSIGAAEAGLLTARAGYSVLSYAVNKGVQVQTAGLVSTVLPKAGKTSIAATALARVAIAFWIAGEAGNYVKEKMEDSAMSTILTNVKSYVDTLQQLEDFDSLENKRMRQAIDESLVNLEQNLSRGTYRHPYYGGDVKMTDLELESTRNYIKKLQMEKQQLEKPTLQEKVLNLKKRIRQDILLREISIQRSHFQSLGRDLRRDGIESTWDRMQAGNLSIGGTGDEDTDLRPFTGSMRETGALREAYIAANRKLNLLGFEPYVISP